MKAYEGDRKTGKGNFRTCICIDDFDNKITVVRSYKNRKTG